MRTRFDVLKRLAACSLLAACGALPRPAWSFSVFACEPEWAALTRTLAPEARIAIATHAGQDPHHIEARPALIAQLRAADLVVCTGAGLEAGWLPTLQQRAGNPKAQDAFFAADQVTLIDARPGAIGTPWGGDVHAQGNPHVQGDPQRLREIAQALAKRLQAEWPDRRADIVRRHAAFDAEWAGKIADWERRAAPLRGRQVASQHTGFGYLWAWLGMYPAVDLEPKPGMPPTPAHLKGLLEGMRAQPPVAIVVAAYQDARAARWVATQLDGKVPLVVLPGTVDQDADAQGLARWMEALLQPLLSAVVP